MPPAPPIRKFSLAFDAQEDRLAWDAEDLAGATTRLWLTQRLCRGLVAAVLPRLQAAAPADAAPRHAAAVQSWEQAAAMSEFGKIAGVQPGPDAASGLVSAVHIRPTADGLELKFDFGTDQSRTVGVAHAGVRQMLAVMRRLYQAAGWPMDIWPDWVEPPTAPPPADSVN
ncbi:MAG: hypothetical protein ACHP84_04780 [Caulobacterales bacterium]